MRSDYCTAIEELCQHFEVSPEEAEEILSVLWQTEVNPLQSVLYPENQYYCRQIIPPLDVSRAWRFDLRVYEFTFEITVYCTVRGRRFVGDIRSVRKQNVCTKAVRIMRSRTTGPP